MEIKGKNYKLNRYKSIEFTMKDGSAVTISAPYYEPSQVSIMVNSKKLIPSEYDYNTIRAEFGNNSDEKCVANVKRAIRKNRNQVKYVTFGFYLVEDSKVYIYSRDAHAMARDDDLQSKLAEYKHFKDYIINDRKCIYQTVQYGEFIPGEHTFEEKKSKHIDITRPLKIKYDYERAVV